MRAHDRVYVIAGKGIDGDRYASRKGAYSGTKRIPDEDRQISIISLQGVQEANTELAGNGNAAFNLSDTRRNVVIDLPADDLNKLDGKRFTIGDVMMEGSELCTPCARPTKLSKKSGFADAFENRGGLRAKIITDGYISTGDRLSALEQC